MCMKKLLYTVIILAIGLSVFSCDPAGEDEGPEALLGQSIQVPNAEGQVEVALEFDDSWMVTGTEGDWFYVSPLSGAAGAATLHINVQSLNPEHSERVSSFTVESGGSATKYMVIQDVTPGIDVSSMAMVGIKGGEYTFSLQGNVKYEAVPVEDWIEVSSIEYDSTLLSDGSTYSKYMTSRIHMTVAPNEGNVREGSISLNGVDGVTNAVVNVTQMGNLEADYGREFLRRSVMMRFTATWCGNCPRMNVGLMDAIEKDPRHILPLTMHVWQSEGGLNYDKGEDYADYFSIDGLPAGFMNNYAEVGGSYPSAIVQNIINDLAVEAAEDLPANTMAAGSSRIEDGNIVVDLSIASKQAGEYLVSVFVLEDGMVYEQLGGSSDYVHNNVARAEMTEMWGDAVSLTANGLLEKTFSIPVPESVLDSDNLHILVMLNRKGSFTGSAQYAIYGDYGYVMDNAVSIPVNGFAVFEYE